MKVASVPAGTKLGKYEVVKPLASGGTAELLLARTAPADRPLVLKWIRPEQAIDGAFVETFVAEGRRAAQLRHPNIVEVHEVGREDGTHYLAMEYVHGDDVRKLLARLHERRAKLPVQHILAIATAVAQALHHAHEQANDAGQPMLHLGIKPGNVIITAEGAVKLADFGIARAALSEGRTELLSSLVGYLSPEQCTGQPVDRRSDVFGLGILMYELSVGRRLFKGDNEFVTMATIVAGDVPPPTKHRGDLPRELEAVIMKALARTPEDRFQNAHEVQVALDKFATKTGVRGSLTTLAGYTKRLFGVRPEPWLVDDEPSDQAQAVDFDNAPRGIASPPPGAPQCQLPDHVRASDDSPILRVRKQVSRDLPTEQLNLDKLRAAPPAPAKSSASNGNARLAPPLRPTPTPVPRGKPKTIQIPLAKEAETPAPVGKDEITKDSLPPSSESVITPTIVEKRDELLTPTTPIDPERAKTTPRGQVEEDTVETAATMHDKPSSARPKLAASAEAPREAAKKPQLPPPRVAAEIKPRAEAPRLDSEAATDVEVIKVESTAVANPPPMPVVATTVARDLTEHVKPLPSPDRITTTESVTIGRKKRRMMIAGALAIAAAAAALVVARGGDGEQAPSSADEVAAADPEPKPEPLASEPGEAATELRTSSVPRTPRNSGVTAGADEQPPEPPKPDEVTVEPPKPEEPLPAPESPPIAKVEPPEPPASAPEPPPIAKVEPSPASAPEKAKLEPPKQPKIEEPPPPRFEEPRDPSPPDDEKVVKKDPKKKEPAKKPVKIARKDPKPKPAPKTAKPAPAAKPKNWDPNALFPTTKK